MISVLRARDGSAVRLAAATCGGLDFVPRGRVRRSEEVVEKVW